MKKRRDRSGRTPLARACAAHEIEAAKECLTEQPGDLDVPDYAGNTPLQIASLGGCAEIVEFLINAGCDIDCKNGDKDTPLIDAVENGHLEVVKLLLHAGVNPRVGNAEGDEPYDLINLDHENHDAIRREIANAKKEGFRTRRSDDQRGRSSSIARDRPRADSAAGARDSTPPLPGHARRRTVRSEATRNDLLWTKPTFENLREFAAKGDMAGAATILNVLQKADTESLIAAAKGGHDEVLGLLLGMGNPDPDPEPHPALKPEYNTPMLAAIGRGNNTVIQLLLDQPDFDPTRRDARGRTYFEISESRRGDYWEQEYDMLKKAYEKFVQKRGRRPDGSPKMLKEREARLPNREPSPSRKAVKGHGPRRPPQEESSHERRRDEPGLTKRPKPTESKSRPQENSDAGLGRDRDTPNSNSGSAEEPPKRRRLFAGRPPPGHANRRESQLSSDSQSGREDAPRPPFGAKKDRGPSLKRSRHSQSPGPYQPSSHRKDGEALKAVKKRKTEVDEVSKPTVTPRVKSPELSAPEQKRRPSVVPPKNSSKSDRPSDETNKPSRPPDIKHESKKPQSVKDTPPTEPATKVEKKAAEPAPRRPMDETASKAMEAERKDREVQLNQDAEKAAADREKRRIEHETRVAEKEKQRMEQEAFAAAAEKEAAAREAMLKKEAEDMAAAEAERQRLERESRAAEAARQAEEAREASRLAKEREAAEEERRRKESEQKRARQAEEERQKRLEQERLRLMRMRREQEDQEQRRRDRLPARLKAAANYIGSNDPIARSRAWLEDFFPIVMATTRQIDQQCNDGVADEYWVPNYLVAPILGTNDLQLSQCMSFCTPLCSKLIATDATWEKRQATPTQRNNLWRVTGRALIRDGNMDVLSATIADVMQRHALTKPLFFAMEHVFWVKVCSSLRCDQSCANEYSFLISRRLLRIFLTCTASTSSTKKCTSTRSQVQVIKP